MLTIRLALVLAPVSERSCDKDMYAGVCNDEPGGETSISPSGFQRDCVNKRQIEEAEVQRALNKELSQSSLTDEFEQMQN